MPCNRCCNKDENGDYIESPCCNYTGVCTAAFTAQSISLCICCGAEMFEENGMNCLALIIIDFEMSGMNGLKLIRWTKDFLLSKNVKPEDLPRFAFR